VQGYFTIIGGFAGRRHGAFVGVILKDWSERKNSVQQLVGMLFPSSSGSPASRRSRTARGAGFSQPVQFVVQNPDIARLAQAMDTLVPRAARHQGSHERGHRTCVFNKPELRVTFDRDRAEDLGVPVRDVAAALQTFLGGRRVSTFTRNDKLYYVMVQLDPSHRATRATCRGSTCGDAARS